MDIRFGKLSVSLNVLRQGPNSAQGFTSVQIGPRPVQDPNNLFCGDDTGSYSAKATLSADDSFSVKYTNMQGEVSTQVTANSTQGDVVTFLPPVEGRDARSKFTPTQEQELMQDTLAIKAKMKEALNQFPQAANNTIILVNTTDPSKSSIYER